VGASAKRHGIPASTLANWLRQADEEAENGEDLELDAFHDGRPRRRHTQNEYTERRQVGGGRRAARKKKVAKQYTPSQVAEVLDEVRASNVTEASRKFGVSRSTIYAWERKEELAAAGQGPSPTEGPDPSDIEAQRDMEILNEWHRQPGLGPSQIRNQLRRKGVKVAVQTVRRVMEEAGYRPPKVKRAGHDERFEAVRPNQLWHLDFTHRYINRASVFTLILLDDYSRFVVGHGIAEAERANVVISTFEEAVHRYGRPEMVLHDKGAAFWSWNGISRFTRLLTDMGVDQIPADHKEWNGKLEVFNGNLHKELFDVHRFHDVAEMRHRLAAHLHWYNYHRTNHALGGLLVPADRYHGRANEVLSAIESGQFPDGTGEPIPVADRLLDVLRVTSRGGQVQVYLMGQRLWPPDTQ
jgi:transposase InsO family protein